MSFLGKAKKVDLLLLAKDMGIEVPSDSRILDIKDLIVSCDKYDENFVCEYLKTIVDERLNKEEQERLHQF